MSRAATMAVGAILALVLVAVLLLVGPPERFAAGTSHAQFYAALALNAVLILSTAATLAARRANNATMSVHIASSTAQVLGVTLSILLTLGLYLGLGFIAFLIAHLLLAAAVALSWLGLGQAGAISGEIQSRQALAANRRNALLSSVADAEVALASAPAAWRSEAAALLAQFREEVGLITASQLDQRPDLMATLSGALEGLRRAAAADAGGPRTPEAALGSMRVLVEQLRRSSA